MSDNDEQTNTAADAAPAADATEGENPAADAAPAADATEGENPAADATERENPGPKSPTMAETEEQQTQPQPPETTTDTEEQQTEPQQPETKKPEKIHSLSFSIWPPTQRTRDAVVKRLLETLSTPSVLSKRYGSLSHDEATDTSRRIEEEAFAFAAASASTEDDGIEILQVYSKDISKRMLDAVKSRSATGSAQDGTSVSQCPDVTPSSAAGEEISSVKTET